jgi:hypothetical protein
MDQTIRMLYILDVALTFDANELWKSAVNYVACIGMERKNAVSIQENTGLEDLWGGPYTSPSALELNYMSGRLDRSIVAGKKVPTHLQKLSRIRILAFPNTANTDYNIAVNSVKTDNQFVISFLI